MKKILLASLLLFSFFSQAQTTYYWVGAAGSAATPTDWASGWNTAPDGSGSARTTSSATDILVFDGRTTPATALFVGNIPKDSAAQLKIINSDTVTFVTTNASTTDAAQTVSFGAVYGGSVIPVIGTNVATRFRLGDYITSGTANPAEVVGINGTDTMYISNEGGVSSNTSIYRVPTLYIKGNPGLTIDATSVLNVGASSTTTLQPFAIVMSAGATGNVFGKINFQSRSLAARMAGVSTGALTFKAGSIFITGSGSSTSSARGYVLGNSLATGSTALGTFSFSNTGIIVFEKGATYQHNAQQNTPFGTTSTATSPLLFSQHINFQPASIYLQTYANGYTPYFYSSGATFGNLVWNSTGFPGSTTTTFFLNPLRVDTLNIMQMASPAGSSAATRIPIYGDFINNSTTSVNFGNIYFAGGGNLQKISGTNTTATFTNLYVINNSNLQLATNITVTTGVGLLGKLDAGSYTINGSGTSTFTNNASSNKTYNSAANSGSATGGAVATANSATITVRGVSNIPVGSFVTSASHPNLIQPNTFVLSYSGAGVYVLSKPATASADSTSTPALSLTFTSPAGTFATSNAAGVAGSFTNYSSYSLGTNANYIFNASTTTPFPAGTISPLPAGDLTINANVTSNVAKLQLAGTLNLNSSILTLREADTLAITSGNAITGTLGTNAYVNITTNASTGSMAMLEADNITGATTFPVANAGNYLPVTVTPDAASTFIVGAFTGATINGKPNGTALTAGQKTNLVDANYVVNRLSGSGNAALRLGFPAALKGSGFNSIQNYQLGISHYDTIANSWDAVTGNGDNTQNFALATFANFSPFRVAVNTSATLPVKLGDITATKVNGSVLVKWEVYTESNLDSYVIERSTDGSGFIALGSVAAQGKSAYTFIDNTPAFGKNLYRVKAVDKDNSYTLTKTALVDLASLSSAIVSPNPITKGFFTVALQNFKQGKVSVKVFSNAGQLVCEKSIQINGGIISQVIYLPSSIAKGNYHLTISDGTSVQNASVIIQ